MTNEGDVSGQTTPEEVPTPTTGARGAGDSSSGGGNDISEEQLKRFLDLLDAVRAKDLPAKSAATGLSPVEIERGDSAFAHELMSALIGRVGPDRTPFARALAQVERTPGTLQIALLNPDDPTKPLRPPNGSGVTVRVKGANPVSDSG
jgi:hypothetical protein